MGSVPIPDPTTLTTEALRREVANVREVIETRLNGMDKAIQILQDISDKFPDRIDEKISSLRQVHEERFRSIATQFAERDTRSEQASKDSKVAIDAALQAQKEAVGEQNKSSALAIAKSETSTTKLIDAMNEKINDVKARQDRGEGQRKGVVDMWGYVLAGVMLIIALASIAIAVLKK